MSRTMPAFENTQALLADIGNALWAIAHGQYGSAALKLESVAMSCNTLVYVLRTIDDQEQPPGADVLPRPSAKD